MRHGLIILRRIEKELQAQNSVDSIKAFIDQYGLHA